MFYNRFNFLIKSFTSQGSTRQEITGVFITPQKSVATDSFQLIEVDSIKADPKDYPSVPNRSKMKTDFKPFILPEKKVADILKFFNGDKSSVLPILENAVVFSRDKENVEIGKVDMEGCNSVMSKIIEGRYPDYKSLMVEKGKYVEISVNPTFLTKIAGFFSNFIEGQEGITIRVPVDGESPIFFNGTRKETGQKAKVVLMPIKSQ